MVTLQTSSPISNGKTKVFFAEPEAVDVRKMRKAELAKWNRMDKCLAKTSNAVCIAKSCSLLAQSWLEHSGCPIVSNNVHYFVEKLLSGQLVEVEGEHA